MRKTGLVGFSPWDRISDFMKSEILLFSPREARMAGKHGGGAWKVAYADFVTAMMALFLMLWITAQDHKIKEAIQRSFTNPFMSITKASTGILPGKTSSQASQGGPGKYDTPTMIQTEVFRKLNEELQKLLEKNPDFEDNTIKLEYTDDGLNISVLDRAHKPVFERDSAQFTEYGRWVFTTLSWVISHYRTFQVELEGHTEQGHTLVRDDYDNWELTSDRDGDQPGQRENPLAAADGETVYSGRPGARPSVRQRSRRLPAGAENHAQTRRRPGDPHRGHLFVRRGDRGSVRVLNHPVHNRCDVPLSSSAPSSASSSSSSLDGSAVSILPNGSAFGERLLQQTHW
jgi:chemotaxis protein MotB